MKLIIILLLTNVKIAGRKVLHQKKRFKEN